MTEEFSRKGESQRPEFWASHLAAMDRAIVCASWARCEKQLEPYVATGAIRERQSEQDIKARAA